MRTKPKIPVHIQEENIGLVTVSSRPIGNFVPELGLSAHPVYAVPRLAPPMPAPPFSRRQVMPPARCTCCDVSADSNADLLAQAAHPGAKTQASFVGIGAPLSYDPPCEDTKGLPFSGVVSAVDVSFSQGLAKENLGQTLGVSLRATVPR